MASKGGWKFRKPRGSRACMVCRLRKVRCNAATQMPCSNCISFGADCRFPEQRKKAQVKQKSYSPQPSTPPVVVSGHGDNLVPTHFVNGVDANHAIPLSNTYNEVPQMSQAFPLPQHVMNSSNINHQIQNQNHNHNQLHHQNQNNGNEHDNNPNPNQILPQHLQSYSQVNSFQQAQPQNMHSSQAVNVPSNQPFVSNPNPQYTPQVPNQGFTPQPNQPYTAHLNHLRRGLAWTQHGKNITVTVDGTSYIPNNPMANISIRNIMPYYNPSNMSTSSSNGVKVSKNRRLSKCLYFGPSSCYSYFVDESAKINQDNAGQDITEKGFNVSSRIDPNEIITELQVLNIKGAFNLPSRPIMLNLFDAFFDNIYPLIPLFNKDIFMLHFNDPNPDKQPPLILIQALLMSGSRSSQHPALVDANHDSASATYAFYQRVKSLYDSSVKFEYVGDQSDEDDGYLAFNYPTVLVQVSCLLSWHWVDPEDVSRGVYFWIRNAITIAQTFGFHRNMEEAYFVKHLLAKHEEDELRKFKICQQVFYWKKIWWWLFCKDRSGAISFGRPLAIDLHDISCEIPTIEDFEKYEPDGWSIDKAEDKLLADFFIHSISLSEIMGLVMQEQYRNKRTRNIDAHMSRSSKVVKQLNLLMGVFFNNLPHELKFTANDPTTMNVYSCLLGALYYVTLYHINRVKIVTIQDKDTNNAYWGISFQAAYMTSLMAQYLGDRYSSGERLLLSPQLVYTMSMAMMILSFHTNSTNKIVARTASKQMNVCLKFSRQCHAAWPGVTYLLITYFTESLISLDKRDVLISRAKSILLKMCREFMLNEEKGKSELLKNLKLFDLNFLLNETEHFDSESSVNENFLWDKDEDDLSLPIFNTISIQLPPLDSEFCKSFDATKLFPKRDANYNLSPSPSPPVLSPEQAKGNSHSRILHLQPNGDAMSAPREPTNPNMSETPLFNDNFADNFAANSTTTTSTSALPAAASYGNESIPLYPTAPDPVYPSFSAQAQQSTSLDYNNAVLDSQYFLNVNSGVNWNSYNL